MDELSIQFLSNIWYDRATSEVFELWLAENFKKQTIFPHRKLILDHAIKQKDQTYELDDFEIVVLKVLSTGSSNRF